MAPVLANWARSRARQEGARWIVFSAGHHLQQPPAPGVNPSPPDPADPNTS